MKMGESNAKPSSPRMPCNHTLCCFLLEHHMGKCARMNTLPEVDFLSMESPSQSESINPIGSSGQLGA